MRDHSYGFRPGGGWHKALQEVQATWTGSRWFVEGDIAKFFDTMNHDVLLAILSEKIRGNRFLRLIRNLVESGYLEEWKFNTTLSGCPQGGVISPLLSNIYLDKLDQYVEKTLIPAYTRGKRRATNPAYAPIKAKYEWKKRQGRREEAKELRKQFQKLCSYDPNDDTYRRLHYVRYAGRRYALRFCWSTTGSRRNQAPIGTIPARDPQAGNVSGENADYPREQRKSAVSELSYCQSAEQCQTRQEAP